VSRPGLVPLAMVGTRANQVSMHLRLQRAGVGLLAGIPVRLSCLCDFNNLESGAEISCLKASSAQMLSALVRPFSFPAPDEPRFT
jgi:hypothetical protein